MLRPSPASFSVRQKLLLLLHQHLEILLRGTCAILRCMCDGNLTCGNAYGLSSKLNRMDVYWLRHLCHPTLCESLHDVQMHNV